jgi:hypothetical protein
VSVLEEPPNDELESLEQASIADEQPVVFSVVTAVNGETKDTSNQQQQQ